MRDVSSHRAYHRLRRGWKLLTASLIGLAVVWSPLLLDVTLPHDLKINLGLVSLCLGLVGALLASLGPLSVPFRRSCQLLALNFALLLSWDWFASRWGAAPWLTLLLTLWFVSRTFRHEVGIPKSFITLPMGCMFAVMALPFLWPAVAFFGTVGLSLYLLWDFPNLLTALPRSQVPEQERLDPGQHALDAITRT